MVGNFVCRYGRPKQLQKIQQVQKTHILQQQCYSRMFASLAIVHGFQAFGPFQLLFFLSESPRAEPRSDLAVVISIVNRGLKLQPGAFCKMQFHLSRLIWGPKWQPGAS